MLLANDHSIVLAGLRRLIEGESDLVVVAVATSREDAVERARRADPDVAVVDLMGPSASGYKVIRQLRRLRPHIHILALSMLEDGEAGRAALDAGADGYLAKGAPAAELSTGIRAVHKGRRFVAEGGAEPVRNEPDGSRSGLRMLSTREREVLELLARGHSNREVADRLRVGVKTIETYRARLRSKLSVKTRAELVRFASTHGLL